MFALGLSIADPAEEARYRSALERIRGAILTEIDDAEAVVTDRHEVASHFDQVLWLRPEDAIETWPVSERLVVAAPWRFQPAIVAMIDALTSGKLGEPGLLRVHRWRQEGSLLQADLDLACRIFASPPDTVYAKAHDGLEQIHLGFSEGGMAIIDSCQNHHYESISLIGSYGAAYADDHHNTQLQFTSQGCQGKRADEGATALVGLLDAFIHQRPTLPSRQTFARLASVMERIRIAKSEGAVS